jgi:hypothetical protein
VLIECYRNNRDTGQMLDDTPAMREKVMDFAFHALREVGRAEQFVEFLTTMCTCGEHDDEV